MKLHVEGRRWRSVGVRREVSAKLRIYGRGRWRWFAVLLHMPKEFGSDRGRLFSATIEAKSWLTDESMRGNLRHKAFVRFTARAGAGGTPNSGRYCPVMGAKARRCTWERGHAPMIVQFAGSPRTSTYAHSWAVPHLGKRATVIQQPRRPKAE